MSKTHFQKKNSKGYGDKSNACRNKSEIRRGTISNGYGNRSNTCRNKSENRPACDKCAIASNRKNIKGIGNRSNTRRNKSESRPVSERYGNKSENRPVWMQVLCIGDGIVGRSECVDSAWVNVCNRRFQSLIQFLEYLILPRISLVDHPIQIRYSIFEQVDYFLFPYLLKL
ncbi:hypothetical protein RchiOBHm_Chr5g0035461 [Rosa chinensis]|uniref:Uncharacterized protein n=1 Tax=Rosa chinensis TaxID=74649 RepID=A0A2P6QB89_ROSCH|nr:hypothetical protein RchiOBHm_Chr5g0035461 [Rosa chinensis]